MDGWGCGIRAPGNALQEARFSTSRYLNTSSSNAASLKLTVKPALQKPPTSRLLPATPEFHKHIILHSNMSLTTHQPPHSWATTPNHKNPTISTRELPAKPKIELVVTEMLPYEDRLRKFLERPGTRSNTTSTAAEVASMPEERTLPLVQPMTRIIAISELEEAHSKAVPRLQPSGRERLSKWWKQELAEQKGFVKALSPYIAF